ncbi:hypothetical protein CCACVL1_14387 [Corchorus capsularis]|uniref:Uncharacterized protein n=1 Tax=Corchorus capsularis TaxID=210143 RepID=A0A1R3I753_COCAP|nr:hypothetical protein CCACVL1_14387 [Corchorus capsularis]
MRCSSSSHLFLLVSIGAVLIFLVSCSHPCEASRVLSEDVLVLQSLQKGPVPPSGHNGCTNVPGGGGPPCISGMNFAAGRLMPPPPPSRLQPPNDQIQMVPFPTAPEDSYRSL